MVNGEQKSAPLPRIALSLPKVNAIQSLAPRCPSSKSLSIIYSKMIRRVLISTSFTVKRTAGDFMSMFHPSSSGPAWPQLQLALAPTAPTASASASASASAASNMDASPSWSDCLWLAVPKRKVSPGKKRMKTTIQKRIQKKDHIIVDSRTGETTLRHRLPFNWKDYLPSMPGN